MVWTEARSAAIELAGLDQSCLFARWMTASAASAPARMLAEVVEVAAADESTLRLEGRGGSVGSGEPGDLMPGGEKFIDGGGTDPSGGSGDENAHGTASLRLRCGRSG